MPHKIDQHTPGRYTCQYGAVYTADGETRIALADRNTSRTTPVERDANMHFLATAPLLLEALQEAEDTFGSFAETEGFASMGPECHAALDTLRDAIAATVYK